jgi:hypothetical protein
VFGAGPAALSGSDNGWADAPLATALTMRHALKRRPLRRRLSLTIAVNFTRLSLESCHRCSSEETMSAVEIFRDGEIAGMSYGLCTSAVRLAATHQPFILTLEYADGRSGA